MTLSTKTCILCHVEQDIEQFPLTTAFNPNWRGRTCMTCYSSPRACTACQKIKQPNEYYRFNSRCGTCIRDKKYPERANTRRTQAVLSKRQKKEKERLDKAKALRNAIEEAHRRGTHQGYKRGYAQALKDHDITIE
jgi:hypothetical protein